MELNICLACERVKEGESECSRIASGMRQGCIMSPWLFNVYMDALMKEVKMGRGENGDCMDSCMKMTWFCVASQRKT